MKKSAKKKSVIQRAAKKRKAPDWKKVGQITVDAGMCWIGDPCYVLHRDGKQEPEDIGKDWHEFCDRLFSREKNGAAQWNHKNGIKGAGKENAGLGVSVSTGWGDGIYDVFARYDDETGRVAEARVVFIDDDGFVPWMMDS